MRKAVQILDGEQRGLPTLRAWRKVRGLTQKELAERAGVTNITIMRLESGKYGGAAADTIKKLAKTLGITPMKLQTELPVMRRVTLEAADERKATQ